MDSPAIKDDWIAIKEFPFPSGMKSQSVDANSSCSEELHDSYGGNKLKDCASFSEHVVGQRRFELKWIEDLNVIQVAYLYTNNNIPSANEGKQNEKDIPMQSVQYISEITVEKLSSIHAQICLYCESLTGCLPDLPVIPKGIWSFVSSVQVPDNFEEAMIKYFDKVRCSIGEKIFLENFFQQEAVTEEEYLENLGDLHRKAYADSVKDADLILGEVIALRDGSINIHDMVTLYSLEDEALEKLEVAKAMVYNFDRQPFLDLREVAHQEIMQCKQNMGCESLSVEEKNRLAEEFAEWKKQLSENQDSLLDLQYQFFESSLKYLIDSRDRMIDDEMRFGKESFQSTSAPERLWLKSKEVADLSSQLLRTKKIMLLKERSQIRQELFQLDDNENFDNEIERVEKAFFSKQIEIYDLELKILEEEEHLLRLYLKTFIKDQLEEEDIFYETFEEQPEDEEWSFGNLSSKEDTGKNTEELKRKEELVRKLNRIFRKRAWLRNKRRKCEGERKSKIKAKQAAQDNFNWHHSIQIKRDRDREELERKKDFIQEMRKKTIDRLKDFKRRYPDPIIKRPPRYLPPVRRTRSGRSSPAQNIESRWNKATDQSQKVVDINSKTHEAKLNAKLRAAKISQTTSDNNSIDSMACISSLPPAPPTAPPLPPVPPPLPPPLPPPMQMPKTTAKTKDAKAILPAASSMRSASEKSTGSNFIKQKGTSDTVDLKQIIFARQNLRTRIEQAPTESPPKDMNDDIMSLIRSGVKLKKVERKDCQKKAGLSDIAASTLKNVLARMNKHMTQSSDEEVDNDDDDEDDDEFK